MSNSIDATSMVLNGLINTRILAICRDLDISAVGLSGVDAGLMRAHRRPPVRCPGRHPKPVDFGFVGDIDAIDASVIRQASGQRPHAGDQPAVGRRQAARC